MNIYRILDIPFFYKLSQIVFAPGKPLFMKNIWGAVYDLNRSPVLDVGCGPKLIGPRPKGELYGVDINANYLSSFLREGERVGVQNCKSKVIVKECSATSLPFEDDFFLEIRANGFLHHMCDDDVMLSAREMYRCLSRGGHLVILEDVWPKSKFRRPLAWLIRRLDRGDFMRTEEELITLFSEAIGGPATCKRYTYTLFGTELCFLKWEK